MDPGVEGEIVPSSMRSDRSEISSESSFRTSSVSPCGDTRREAVQASRTYARWSSKETICSVIGLREIVDIAYQMNLGSGATRKPRS